MPSPKNLKMTCNLRSGGIGTPIFLTTSYPSSEHAPLLQTSSTLLTLTKLGQIYLPKSVLDRPGVIGDRPRFTPSKIRSVGWVSVANTTQKATRDLGAARNPPDNRARCADGGLRRMPSEVMPSNRHMRLTHPTKTACSRSLAISK